MSSEKSEKTRSLLADKTVALEGLGDALYGDNKFLEARKTFEKLAKLQNGKPRLRALRKAVVAAFYQIDIPKIQELTEMAETIAAADRVEAARILDHKGRIAGLQGNLEYCLKQVKDSIGVYEEEYSLPDAAWDLFALSFGEASFGELERGVVAALQVSRSVRNPWGRPFPARSIPLCRLVL